MSQKNIKILSASTVSKIFAGEVIEKPASVVKELVENSIDAGATKIEIVLEQSGKNLITVRDNGYGMSKEDLELSVQRHTTSKLDEENLLNIRTLGFRGEALPSISTISKFKISSKKRGEDVAYAISIQGGVQGKIERVYLDEGTTVEVRDLFFATPARLKFLRTDKTELIAIIIVLKKLALSYPYINFILKHEEKEIIKVRDSSSGNLKERVGTRITEIMGGRFLINSAWIDFKSENVSVYGYASIPTYNKANNGEQFFFVNNRPVKDKILNLALKIAYHDFLPKKRYPFSSLFLNLPSNFVDVNVHPSKAEVRFYNPNLVRSTVTVAIKEALNVKKHKISTALSESAVNYIIQQSKRNNLHNGYHGNFLEIPPEKKVSVMTETKTTEFSSDCFFKKAEEDITPIIEEKKISNSLSEKSNQYLGTAKAQFYNTYILSETRDSIIITDQHAAHERIGYEKIKEQLKKQGISRQRLLIPEIVELSSIERVQVLDVNKNHLLNLGLSLEIFGLTSVIVSEVPSILVNTNIDKLINDLSDCLLEFNEHMILNELIEQVAATYACYQAIRAGKTLSVLEMNELLRQIESTPFSAQCNHGRPAYLELRLQDLEKLFSRRK